jgi:hypothetical protein
VKDRAIVLVSTVVVAAALGHGVRVGAEDASPPPFLRGSAPRTVSPREAPPPPTDAHEVPWEVLLSYEHRPGLLGLPDAIKALDGKKVVMNGFLLPLYEYEDIREFGLVANHMSCCFGFPPGINGMVLVKLSTERGLPNTSEPIRVVGTFLAKETMESGYVLGIYSIEDATALIIGY